MAPETLSRVSIEEFWHLAHRLERAELVAGQVVELTPPTYGHAAIVMGLGVRLSGFVRESALGQVIADAGFVLSTDPPTVRAPDVAVLLTARLTPSPPKRGFMPGAPDLAIEVLSPEDRPGEVAVKVAEYLRAGAQAVWVVDPEDQTMTVHLPDRALRYSAHETLDGAPVLPGFTLPLADLFAEVPA